MIKVTRNIPTAESLKDIYRTIQEIFTDQTYYYDNSEIEELKTNPVNIFLKEKE